MKKAAILISLAMIFISCQSPQEEPAKMTEEKPDKKTITFREDVEFLQKHTGIVLLGDENGQGMLVAAPAWQGRVMTSTASGPDGQSFGWINRELISSGEILEHMNPFGGEDRLWLTRRATPLSAPYVGGRPPTPLGRCTAYLVTGAARCAGDGVRRVGACGPRSWLRRRLVE